MSREISSFFYLVLSVLVVGWMVWAFTGCTPAHAFGSKQKPVPVEAEKPPVIIVAPPPAPPLADKPFLVASPRFKTEWVKMLSEKIDVYGKPLINNRPKDWGSYCKTDFEKLTTWQRKQFYIMMLSKLAEYESSYNPRATYKEDFKNSKGEWVISAGIFQNSLESGKGYGCPYKEQNDLFDPNKNIECAVKIVNRWVGERDRVIAPTAAPWLGMARYFGPFRREKRKLIMAPASALEFCKA